MISYNGFNEGVLTFKDTDTKVGYPVDISESGLTRNAESGKDFIGVCVSKDNDYITVQVCGYIEMKYTGTLPNYGYQALVSNGSGGVKASTATTKLYKVLKVDTANNIIGFII